MPTLARQRLEVVDARGFTAPGVGTSRRADLTAVTRQLLVELWRDATLAHPRALRPGPGVALACTGSLARGDGGPLGDLDLVLLHDARALSRGDLTDLADRLWYPLWDSGVGLDHSVRTISQCRTVGAQDLNVAMALLDLQPVAGDAALVERARRRFAEDWRATSRKRLPELVAGITERHEAVGDLAQQLHPDLKEARGGLRDMTVLTAITRSWLADRPHGAPDLAYSFLLDVRDALQYATGRPRSRLAPEDQQPVAELLGVGDRDDLLAAISTAARTLDRALTQTLRSAGQSQRARGPRLGPRRPELTSIGNGIYVHDSEVVLGRGSDPGRATQLLQASAEASTRNLPLAPVTASNLAQSWPGLAAPWPEEARDLLVAVLGGAGLIEVWAGLDEVGVVERWLPAWAAVRGRPQRNGVHQHTVDRHLLEAVRHAQARSGSVARPDLLLVAALLHDIGKVAGSEDHAATGAPIAAAAARAWGFAVDDVAVIELLVRQHLALAELATTRDPSDPATVAELLARVEHRTDCLELLLALTEADARAVGAKAWSPWRASLVQTLAGHARARLEGHDPAAPPPASARSRRRPDADPTTAAPA